VHLRLVRVRVPLLRPHRAAHGDETVRDVVLIGWSRPDGVQGWSECSTLSDPGYATETTDQAWVLLATRLGPQVIEGTSAPVAGAVAASSALLDAALDAQLRAAGRSLVDELGGVRATLPRCVVVAAPEGAALELVGAARRAIEGGAEMVKLKVAPWTELSAVGAVVDAVGARRVAVDANGTCTDPDRLRTLDGFGLAYLEQPWPAGITWDELATLRRSLRTRVALDESLVSLEAVHSALRAGALDVVSVKPLRLGGVAAAATAVGLAEEHGVEAFVGGMLELGIARAAAAAVATLAGATLPTDLGPSSAYVERDLCEPVVVDERGRLVVPTGPGSGRVPSEERLAEVTVDEVVLSA
jgi:O-succinylbenzoate synthase